VDPGDIKSECWVLDVGQGSSQIITLPDGGMIIIDCGKKGSSRVTKEVLQRYKNSPIELFIVTHNDADHDGAAAELFPIFSDRVKKLCFLHDRPHDDIRLWPIILSEEKRRNKTWPKIRLERSHKHDPLYSDSANDIFLDVLAPDFQRASAKIGDGNAMSGILLLRCGSRKIVFPGDSTTDEWRDVHRNMDARLDCDVMVIPHHGSLQADLPWLYSNAVRPEYGIISVGSSNKFGKHEVHPNPETVRELNSQNIKVLCTQMTPHCCQNLESIRPGLVLPHEHSLSSVKGAKAPAIKKGRSGKATKSKNVGCAGTVIIQVGHSKVEILPFAEHQRAIDARIGMINFHPLCRAKSTTPSPSKSTMPPLHAAG
jgi:competence protein ComEC